MGFRALQRRGCAFKASGQKFLRVPEASGLRDRGQWPRFPDLAQPQDKFSGLSGQKWRGSLSG